MMVLLAPLSNKFDEKKYIPHTIKKTHKNTDNTSVAMTGCSWPSMKLPRLGVVAVSPENFTKLVEKRLMRNQS